MNRSESISKLTEALASARLDFKQAKKNTANKFYSSKYADLAEIIQSSAGALSQNGLAVIQLTGLVREGHVFLTTLLTHTSGEWLSEESSLPVTKQDAQGCGSALTYLRRYSYQALLNIAADADDDANEAVEPGKPSEDEYHEAFIQREAAQPKVERIAQFQVKALFDVMKKTGKTEAQVTERLQTIGCVQFEQVEKKDFNDMLKWMRAPTNPPADLTETLQKSVEAVEETKKPADGRSIKMKRMFAIAKKKNIPEADLRQMAKEVYGREHFTEMLIPEIEGIIEWADQFVMEP